MDGNDIYTQIAGVAGSATSALLSDIKSAHDRLIGFVAGLGAIYALTDTIMHLTGLDIRASAYLVGIFSYNLTIALLRPMRRFGDDADYWILLKESVMRYISRGKTDGNQNGN